MRVKKYEAESVLDAMAAIKRDLGPEAIILSTKEESKGFGQPTTHIVVAAVTEEQFKKKEMTEKKLGEKYQDKFLQKSAHQQKNIIDSVYKNLEDKYQIKNRKITATPYIDIADEAQAQPPKKEEPPVQKATSPGQRRVKQAAEAALSASLGSQFFSKKPQPKNVEVRRSEVKAVTEKSWPPETQDMMRKLRSAGLENSLIENLVFSAIRDLQPRGRMNKAAIEAWCAKRILQQVKTVQGRIPRGVEFFVGPSGSGKTTALVKLAAEYVMNHRRKVAILTTDTQKVGGIEQHKVYSRILNVHFEIVNNIRDWKSRIQSLESFDNILVDTPGVSMNRADEMEFLRELVTARHGRETESHLVLSAMTKAQDLSLIVRNFNIAQIKDVIFTHIDQTSQHGLMVNFQEKFQIPFHSFGTSSDIIDGFEWATRERILDLLFKLTRINGEKSYGSVL